MKSLNILYAFLGGAIVGCGAAILLAPEKVLKCAPKFVLS